MTATNGTIADATQASAEQPALPVIDYAKLVEFRKSSSPESVQISTQEQKKLIFALRNVGFVYLQNHTLSPAVQRTMFENAKGFFAKPEDEKARIETSEAKAFHGWFCPQRTSGDKGKSDQKEAFDIGDDSDPSRPNQWPTDWPEFRANMVHFFEECHQIHLELFRALADQVSLDTEYFTPFVQDKDHFFRVLYYPETTSDSFKDRFRASPHTDYGTLTLLFNDSNGGLQVRNKAGQYVDAPPIENAAIVNGMLELSNSLRSSSRFDRSALQSANRKSSNRFFPADHCSCLQTFVLRKFSFAAPSTDRSVLTVGDMLSRWFNDTLKSTEHRVIEPSVFNKNSSDIPDVIPARYAIAWFGQPNRNALIEPISACCTAENPKKYEPVFAGQHVTERLARLHKDGKNTEKWEDTMARNGNSGSQASKEVPVSA